MENIQTEYVVNDKTAVLLPINHHRYKTIVLETDQKILVNKPILQIIKDSCLHYGSDFEGRRKAVIYQLGYKRKVPIPISIASDIYAFPTHAVKDTNCIWVFLHHLSKSHHPVRKSKTNTEVYLKNSESLTIGCSLHIIKKQIQRAILCKTQFSQKSIPN